MTQPARSITFPSGDFTLEGVLHLPNDTPAAAAVICHPGAQYGGDMYNHVVMAMCEALNERGYIALRFNMQGVGGSQGEMDMASGPDDARAALEYIRTLREVDGEAIGLIGYSVGAMAAAEAASADLKAVALVSPPLGFGDLRVDPGCPVLVACGDNDEFAPIDRLRIVGEQTGVELAIIDNAEHFWHGTQDRLKDPVGDFFARHLG
jgi:alpha/beta superfamily hydrolase